MPEDTKTTPRDVLRAMFRRWRVFVPASLVFMVLVLVAAHWVPLKYTGETIFERRIEGIADAMGGSKSESFEAYRVRLRQDLAGYHAVEKAVEDKDLGLEEGMPRGSDGSLTPAGQMAKQKLVRKLMKAIDVRWDVRSEGADRVSVTFTHADPDLAQRMPDALVKNYIDRIGQQIILRLSLQKGHLAGEVNDTAAELTQLETKKTQSEKKHVGMMPGNPWIVQERIQQISTDIDTLRRQDAVARKKLAGLEAYMASFKQATTRPATQPATTRPATGPGLATQPATQPTTQPATQPTTQPATQPATQPTTQPATQPATQPGPATQPTQIVMGPNPELRRLEARLQGYKDRLDDALIFQRMKNEHPRVKQLRRKIAQLNEKIKDTPKEVELHRVYEAAPRRTDDREALRRQLIAQRRQDLLMQLASARTEVEVNANELERSQERLSSLQRLMANFGPIRQEYQKILRDIEDKQAERGRWKSQLTGVQMALAGEAAKRRTHLKTVQAAQEQFRPTFPALWLVLALAVIGGLGLAGGLVFLTSALDRSISTSEQATQHFDLPVHGVIGEIVTSRQRTRRKIRRWLLGSLVTVVIALVLGLSTFSNVLRLRYPDQFKKWRANPVGYMARKVTQSAERLR